MNRMEEQKPKGNTPEYRHGILETNIKQKVKQVRKKKNNVIKNSLLEFVNAVNVLNVH
jgi:hypothetical protein